MQVIISCLPFDRLLCHSSASDGCHAVTVIICRKNKHSGVREKVTENDLFAVDTDLTGAPFLSFAGGGERRRWRTVVGL